MRANIILEHNVKLICFYSSRVFYLTHLTTSPQQPSFEKFRISSNRKIPHFYYSIIKTLTHTIPDAQTVRSRSIHRDDGGDDAEECRAEEGKLRASISPRRAEEELFALSGKTYQKPYEGKEEEDDVGASYSTFVARTNATTFR